MLTNCLCASVLATMLLAGSPGLVLAQTAGTAGPGIATVANTRGGYGYGWWGGGWWGLWGLVGLFGLTGGRSRYRGVPPLATDTTPDLPVGRGPGSRRL